MEADLANDIVHPVPVPVPALVVSGLVWSARNWADAATSVYGPVMRSILLFAAALTALSSSACTRSAPGPQDATKETWAAYAGRKKASAASASAARAATGPAERTPGDFIVRRFSGSFAKSPMTLTERVVARDGTTLVIDVTLDDGKKSQTMRTWLNDAPAARGELIKVAKMDGDVESPSDIAAYEAMMQKVVMAADQNEEMLSESETSMDVGGAALACRERTFRVRIGKRSATMRTVESDRFAWGDVAAEITTAEGKMLYKAEVVETGRGEPGRKAAPVAASIYDE